jgi:hypothetical protein
VRVIGELATMHGKVKQVVIEEEEKITNLTCAGGKGDSRNKGLNNN